MQARTLTFLIILSLVVGFVASTQPALGATEDGPLPAPELRQQIQAGVRTIAAAEFAFYAKSHSYADERDLVANEYLSEKMFDLRENGDISYEIALYRNAEGEPRRFIVFGRSGGSLPRTAWLIDETGLVREANWHRSAQWYMEIEPFFSKIDDWAAQADAVSRNGLFNVQLAVERWTIDHSKKGGTARYPMSIEAVVIDGYIDSGYYANPLRSDSYDELTAIATPMGEWSPGDFSYVPHVYQSTTGEWLADGYMLIGYSTRRHSRVGKPEDLRKRGISIVLASDERASDWFQKAIAEPDDIKQPGK